MPSSPTSFLMKSTAWQSIAVRLPGSMVKE